MKIDQVRNKVKGIPHMSYSQAEEMTAIIIENKFNNILELGFKHGVSTCYMAGALDELGRGRITTIDLVNARSAEPNIDSLLGDLGFDSFVTVFYEPTSYIWRLMKMLEEDPSPRFDFCYIDGAHNWFTDGFAFFLVDRLLNPGGLIVFDDIDWTYNQSPTMKNTDIVRNMPADEKTAPHIRKVYEILVKAHPAYDNFLVKDDWAHARKMLKEPGANTGIVRTEIVYQRDQSARLGFLNHLARKGLSFLRRKS